MCIRDSIGAVEGFLAGLEEDLVELKEFEWRQMKKTEEELIELFYFKFQEIPLLERMYAVMDYVVDEFETLYDRDLSEEELAAVREKFDQMYVTRDVYRIYNWFLEENEMCIRDRPSHCFPLILKFQDCI